VKHWTHHGETLTYVWLACFFTTLSDSPWYFTALLMTLGYATAELRHDLKKKPTKENNNA
jgi:hypothetical protein